MAAIAISDAPSVNLSPTLFCNSLPHKHLESTNGLSDKNNVVANVVRSVWFLEHHHIVLYNTVLLGV